jgi:hypothetical protein
MTGLHRAILIIVATFLANPLCTADPTNFVENITVGEFSSDTETPTLLAASLGIGTNTITGAATSSGLTVDIDAFQINLPNSLKLDSITVDADGIFPGPSFFDVMYDDDGNTGTVAIASSGSYNIPFAIGNPDKIAFSCVAPFDPFFSQDGNINYVMNLVVKQRVSASNLVVRTATEITWDSTSGTVYRVQWRNELDTNTWSQLGSPVVSTGTSARTYDSTYNVPHRFYRVLED